MTEPNDAIAEPQSDEVVPFESLPMLAADEDFIAKMERLRELKLLWDSHFKESRSGAKDSEFDLLKTEIAAMAMVAGAKSISYLDLTITNVDGGMIKGIVTGPALISQIHESSGGHPPTLEQLQAIASAAEKCNVQALVDGGISPMLVARAKSPDQPRSSSIQVRIIGRAGKGKSGAAARGRVQ